MPLTDPEGDHPAVAHAKTARRKQARPSELVAAALDLFVEKGFAATRAEEVATRAGVSRLADARRRLFQRQPLRRCRARL